MDWVKELLEFVVIVTRRRYFSRTGENGLDRVKRSFRNWRGAYGKAIDGGIEEDKTNE